MSLMIQFFQLYLCPITEYAFFPIPVSISKLLISFSLTFSLFNIYVISRSEFIYLAIVISSESISKYLSLLSITVSTLGT